MLPHTLVYYHCIAVSYYSGWRTNAGWMDVRTFRCQTYIVASTNQGCRCKLSGDTDTVSGRRYPSPILSRWHSDMLRSQALSGCVSSLASQRTILSDMAADVLLRSPSPLPEIERMAYLVGHREVCTHWACPRRRTTDWMTSDLCAGTPPCH